MRARRSFPNKNEQDFSPKIVEKNPVKMEKNLDLTFIVASLLQHPSQNLLRGIIILRRGQHKVVL